MKGRNWAKVEKRVPTKSDEDEKVGKEIKRIKFDEVGKFGEKMERTTLNENRKVGGKWSE